MSKQDDAYRTELEALQVALVRYQQHAIASGEKALLILEGRDAAGKDGAIRRITEHLSTRHTRAVALPKPSDRERSEWYFQRYADHLPAAGEFVIFNRSWYNRAGVERVMGFSTPEEQETFLRDVPVFESMLIGSGMKIMKVWLDISREEQADRLEARRTDPLKVLKVSPLDAVAQKKWKDYSEARDEMLRRSSCEAAPWFCVVTDKKKQARLNVMRHILHTLAPREIAKSVEAPDPDVLFLFTPSTIQEGRLNK
jgi:polyphosphate kinase